MNIIQPEDSPQKVNKLLMDEWRISLFKFAQVFAVSPVELFLRRGDYPFTSQETRGIKLNLRKMQDDILKRGRYILKITDKLRGLPAKGMSDDELIKHMRLERFFEDYIHRHEKAVRYIEKVCLQGKRGSGINKKSIIAVGWGNMISYGSRRKDWKMLGDLYFWLWERLPHDGFYKELKPGYGIEEDLRMQYNRHRWAGGAENYLLKKLKIKKGEIAQFSTNWLMHLFMGDKEEYFKEKPPETEDEFPRLFLNILVDYYLAGREGLTLFSKNQSLADPGFLFLFIWLQQNAGKDLFPKLDMGNGVSGKLFENAEMPYTGSEIGDYFNCAVNIYLDHKVDLINPPPLIIFSDRSYFSTGF